MRFPLYIDLERKPVIVFGGGAIATRRIRTLLPFGCKITVIAPQLKEELMQLVRENQITWLQKEYESGDCHNAYMVMACTNHRTCNHQIYEEAIKQNCLVNICDCKEECTFYFPAIATKGEVVVGITASGTDHHLAKQVAQDIRTFLKE